MPEARDADMLLRELNNDSDIISCYADEDELEDYGRECEYVGETNEPGFRSTRDWIPTFVHVSPDYTDDDGKGRIMDELVHDDAGHVLAMSYDSDDVAKGYLDGQEIGTVCIRIQPNDVLSTEERTERDTIEPDELRGWPGYDMEETTTWAELDGAVNLNMEGFISKYHDRLSELGFTTGPEIARQKTYVKDFRDVERDAPEKER